MHDKLIKLYDSVYLNYVNDDINADNKSNVDAFINELAFFRFAPSDEYSNNLYRLSHTDFNNHRLTIIDILKNEYLVDKKFNTLFRKYPYEIPSEKEYFSSRLLAFFIEFFHDECVPPIDLIESGGSCGCKYPKNLFDLSLFGGCPVCQFVDGSLVSQPKKLHDFKQILGLKTLHCMNFSEVHTKVSNILYRQSSISKLEKSLLLEFIKNNKITIQNNATIFKETLPLFFDHFNIDFIKSNITSCSDVLRIASYLSNEDADLSLKENTFFKLRTSQKNKILNLLEHSIEVEDLLKNREKWLRLGEKLYVGSKKNVKKFPKTAKAFYELRNNHKSIVTFNKVVESSMKRGLKISNIEWVEFLTLMESRPGEFARRFDNILRKIDNRKIPEFLKSVKNIVKDIRTDMLITLEKHFNNRDNTTEDRIFFPKGSITKAKIIKDNRKNISHNNVDKIVNIFTTEILNRLGDQDLKNKKFYLDDKLNDLIIPFNKRGESDGLLNFEKGSKYSFGDGEVIRLFAVWKDNIDIDLSAIFYDSDMGNMGVCSYYDNGDKYVKHSGDIQGNITNETVSEFIDINIDEAIEDGIRYVSTNTISYNGGPFCDNNVDVGYMMRDSITSGDVYEPTTLESKIKLETNSTTHVTFVFDLLERQVILLDIATGNSSHMNTNNMGDRLGKITKSFLNLTNIKPTYYDYLEKVVLANGKFTFIKNEADVIFTMENNKFKQISDIKEIEID